MYVCRLVCVRLFVWWQKKKKKSDLCSPNNNKLPSVVVQQSPTVVRCVLTVEKTWLTTFLGTINAAVICFYYRTGVFNFKFLLSDVNLSHNTSRSHHFNHKQRRWHNNHLSIAQYSAGKRLDTVIYMASPGWRTCPTTPLSIIWTLWHKLQGWIEPSNQTVKQIWFTTWPQRVVSPTDALSSTSLGNVKESA